MQFVQNLKRRMTTLLLIIMGVNGPTGPITPKAYGPFTPQVNFMLFASNIIYSMPFIQQF